jgi:hypothetical protein
LASEAADILERPGLHLNERMSLAAAKLDEMAKLIL